MKKYIFIILLVGVCFGQDEYPYFSDMAKQLEFEKKRIIIEEGESTQQIITGGGSEFNPWSLLTISPNVSPYLRDAIPAYKTAPIKTTYRYNSYFNIQRDGKNISEIEMLKIIGLEQEADKIISDYEKKILAFNESPMDTVIDVASMDTYKTKLYWYNLITFAILVDLGERNPNGDGSDAAGGMLAAIILYLSIKIFSINPNDYLIIEKSITEPVLQQQLNTAQTKSMVEAYNRKLYSEIAKK